MVLIRSNSLGWPTTVIVAVLTALVVFLRGIPITIQDLFINFPVLVYADLLIIVNVSPTIQKGWSHVRNSPRIILLFESFPSERALEEGNLSLPEEPGTRPIVDSTGRFREHAHEEPWHPGQPSNGHFASHFTDGMNSSVGQLGSVSSRTYSDNNYGLQVVHGRNSPSAGFFLDQLSSNLSERLQASQPHEGDNESIDLYSDSNETHPFIRTLVRRSEERSGTPLGSQLDDKETIQPITDNVSRELGSLPKLGQNREQESTTGNAIPSLPNLANFNGEGPSSDTTSNALQPKGTSGDSF
jgi:hypothetical protein